MAENHLAFGVLCYSSMAYSTLTDIFTYEEGMFIEQISVNFLKLYQVRSLSEIQTENYLLFRVIMPVSINIKIFEYYNTIIFFFSLLPEPD